MVNPTLLFLLNFKVHCMEVTLSFDSWFFNDGTLILRCSLLISKRCFHPFIQDFVMADYIFLWLTITCFDFLCHLFCPTPCLLGLLLMLLKARSPLDTSLTCLSSRMSMEDLNTQRSTSMDWLSKLQMGRLSLL